MIDRSEKTCISFTFVLLNRQLKNWMDKMMVEMRHVLITSSLLLFHPIPSSLNSSSFHKQRPQKIPRSICVRMYRLSASAPSSQPPSCTLASSCHLSSDSRNGNCYPLIKHVRLCNHVNVTHNDTSPSSDSQLRFKGLPIWWVTTFTIVPSSPVTMSQLEKINSQEQILMSIKQIYCIVDCI